MKKRGRPKSQDKFEQINRAAVELFVKEGYERTSMQKIAELAGVSKRTLYSHFENKESLFRECVARKAQLADIQLKTDMHESFEQGMYEITLKYLNYLSDPEIMKLWRLMIAESETHPELAEYFHQQGPVNIRKVFSDYMERFPDCLNIDDYRKAARIYISLASSVFLHKTLLGIALDTSPSANKIRAREALEMFENLFGK